MTVISQQEIHNGRDGGSETTKDGKTVRRYSRVIRVVTDDNYDEATVVLAAMPVEGSVYPDDASAYLRRRRARNESFSKRVWLVTLAYSSEKEMEENPLDEPAEISWDTEQFQRPAEKNRAGKAILNAAKDHFDPPPERDDSRITILIRKNLAVVPAWILKCADRVNEGEIEIDGITIAAGEAKLQKVRVSKWQERNDIAYRVVDLIIHLRDKEDASHEPWALHNLNAGFHCTGRLESEDDPDLQHCVTKGDGQPVTTPALLDVDGKQIMNPTVDNATYIDDDIYKELDFSTLPLS